MSKIDDYAEEFSFLEDDDRLIHLIDLAKRSLIYHTNYELMIEKSTVV